MVVLEWISCQQESTRAVENTGAFSKLAEVGAARTQRGAAWWSHCSVQGDFEVASGAWVGDRRDFNVVTELVGERLRQGVIVSFVASSSTVLNGDRGESHAGEVVVCGWRRQVRLRLRLRLQQGQGEGSSRSDTLGRGHSAAVQSVRASTGTGRT